MAFITNNSTSSRQQYLDKFHRLGLTHVSLDEIFSCGSASASYLQEVVLPNLPANQQGIYLIGQESLEHELAEKGLRWTGGTDPEDDVLLPPQDFSSITPDPSIGVVLYGFASESYRSPQNTMRLSLTPVPPSQCAVRASSRPRPMRHRLPAF